MRKYIGLQVRDYEVLKKFSEKVGKPMTKTITFAIETLTEILDSLFSEKLDVGIWYCEKMSFSLQMLKEKKTEEQLKRFMNLLDQVEKRYGVDVSFMKESVLGFMKGNCDIVFLNESLKELLKDLVRSIILGRKMKELKDLIDGERPEEEVDEK